MQGFGNITEGGKNLAGTFESMRTIVMDSIGKAMEGFGLAGGVFDEMSGAGISLGEQLGKQLPEMLTTFAVYVGKVIEALPGIWEGIKSFTAGVKTAFNVIGGVFDVLAPAVSFVAGIFVSLGNLIKGIFGIFGSAPDPKIDEVGADGKPTQDALDAQAKAAAESSRGLGKLSGGAALAV